ncbi:unnamed protein product [Taenia asiatica]|uniref:Uncharacterized protein n=1 Tax=Taenia asiatica TaxID=60517 RepID=A0A0R3VVS8_TAEAS|nr:unnamed protein product [Taenia asiatica]
MERPAELHASPCGDSPPHTLKLFLHLAFTNCDAIDCGKLASTVQLPSWSRLVSSRLGSARLGSARLGSARLGSARLVGWTSAKHTHRGGSTDAAGCVSVPNWRGAVQSRTEWNTVPMMD